MQKLRRVDKKRFKELIYPHLLFLYNVALKYSGKPYDAEDLVQETIYTAYGKFSQLRDDMPDRLPGSIDLSLKSVSERSGGRKYAFYGICSAVVALMAVFFVAFLLSSTIPSIDDMGRYMAADHKSHDDSSLTINRLDEIRLLADHAIDQGQVQSEVPAGSVFVGGRLCPLGKDCLALHLVFIHQGKRISLYIIEEKDVVFPRSAEYYHLLDEGGETVRFWKKGKYVYGMIG